MASPCVASWPRSFLVFESLALFLIHSRPVVGNFQVKVAIADGSLLEPLLQVVRAGRGDVLLRHHYSLTAETRSLGIGSARKVR